MADIFTVEWVYSQAYNLWFPLGSIIIQPNVLPPRLTNSGQRSPVWVPCLWWIKFLIRVLEYTNASPCDVEFLR